jgi:hypothetical protein
VLVIKCKNASKDEAIIGAIALTQWLNFNTWAAVIFISSASLLTSRAPTSAAKDSAS